MDLKISDLPPQFENIETEKLYLSTMDLIIKN